MRRNAIGILAFGMVRRATAFAAFALITRTSTGPTFQAYVLILTLGELFRAVLIFASDQVLLRLLGESQVDDKWTSGSCLAKVILSVAASVLAAFAAHGLGYSEAVARGVLWLFPYFLAAGLNEAIAASIQSRNLAWRAAPLALAASAIYLGVVAGASLFGAPLNGFIVALVASEAALLAVQAGFLVTSTTFRLSFEPRRAFLLVKESAFVGVGAIVTLTYFRLDTLLLGHFHQNEVGTYATSYKVTEATLLVAVAVATSLLVELPKHVDDAVASIESMRRATSVVVGFLLIAEAVYAITGQWIIPIVFSAKYAGAYPAAVILGAAAIVMGSNIVTANALIAFRAQRSIFVLTLGLLGLNIVLNLALIPRWGYVGAAWATLLTEYPNLVVQTTLLIRLTGRFPHYPIGLVAVGSGVLIPISYGTRIPLPELSTIPAILLGLLLIRAGIRSQTASSMTALLARLKITDRH